MRIFPSGRVLFPGVYLGVVLARVPLAYIWPRALVVLDVMAVWYCFQWSGPAQCREYKQVEDNNFSRCSMLRRRFAVVLRGVGYPAAVCLCPTGISRGIAVIHTIVAAWCAWPFFFMC